MEQRKGRRLLLFPLPLQGHINPMLQLANILHSKGFSITIIHTTFNSPDPSKYPHFTFHFIQENLSESESPTKDILSLLSLLNIKCFTPFHDCLSKLLSEDDEPISCLISDAIFHFTQFVANNFNLPRLVLRTGGASSFLVFSAFPFLKEKGYLPIQESQLEEPVLEFPPLKVKDLPVINTSQPELLYELVVNMVDGTKGSSGLIWNTFEDLEQPAIDTIRDEFNISVFPIGPFHKFFTPSPSSSLLTQDESCISWLDKQEPKSVLYVSFGSIASIKESDFLEIAYGLANSNQTFLWVIRPGLVHGKEWDKQLPNGLIEDLNSRGKIVKWAPQLQVLGHFAIGAFWTHNGWNSTLESICEGVPMICMPCFTDQKVNARYVSEVWRIGLQLENGFDREKIEKMIKRLMVEKEGEERRKRILGLKEKSNLCFMEDGSSSQFLDRLITHILSLKPFTFKTQ